MRRYSRNILQWIKSRQKAQNLPNGDYSESKNESAEMTFKLSTENFREDLLG